MIDDCGLLIGLATTLRYTPIINHQSLRSLHFLRGTKRLSVVPTQKNISAVCGSFCMKLYPVDVWSPDVFMQLKLHADVETASGYPIGELFKLNHVPRR